MNLILLGPPGAGKGTQAEYISEKFNLAHTSTGDILRAAIKAETEVGKKAKEFVESGKLVPDSIILDLIEEVIKKSEKEGFLFDGFPRTIEQAEGLEKLLKNNNMKIDRVLNLKVESEAIIKRLVSRRVCGNCKATYNLLSKPPKKEGICDVCGGKLIQRKDDSRDVIENRINVYNKQTKPLIEFYKERGILSDIDAGKTPDEVDNEIQEVLSSIS